MENQTCYCELKKEAKSKLVFEQGDLYYCGDSECKERIKAQMGEEFESSLYQGRTFEQYKSSANITYYAVLGLIGFIIGYILFTLVNLL